MEIKVKGHSGCVIDIVNEGNNLRIHKWSKDPKYITRLYKQAEKQMHAAQEEYQHIRIPQIFKIEKDEQHVLINMEYVYSRNFIEFFESAGFEQIDYFIKALILFLEKELKSSPVQSIPTSITFDKYLDVENKVAENALLSSDVEIKEIMAECRVLFEKFNKKESIEIPMGQCHGDLTFSNILFNGNNYYLIDFLDSFIESPLLDIVKIRQDSAHLWSQLMYENQYDKLRLKIVCEKIDKEIDGYARKYSWYCDYYEIYQLMNLLRVLQYAKEERVITYLKTEIGKMLLNKQPIVVEESINTHVSPCKKFSLIVPAAADTDDESLPYVFNLNGKGFMLCVDAIRGLNLEVFTDIYFTILRKHVDLFSIDEMLNLQIKKLGLKNVQIVILDKPTISQTETLYQTIKQAGIEGGIFIKDADGYFSADIHRENSISVFPLEEMPLVDPQHKSYVKAADMKYVTNIIERRVVSNYFNVGGYGFDDVRNYVLYYKRLVQLNEKMYLSHIVYAMLLDKLKFQPIEVKNYIDWGNKRLYEYYMNQEL